MSHIKHHPESATLTAYAAGSLPAAMALVVGCHLEFCAQCRQTVAKAENVGGTLIDDVEPLALSSRARTQVLDLLDAEIQHQTPTAETKSTSSGGAAMPEKLRRLLGTDDLTQLAWRSAGPGVRLLTLECGEGNAVMLDIAPNHVVPVHTHRGNELTLILKGDYTDCVGEFAPGDVADLDGDTEHQPKAGDLGCLCLAGMDAQIRYKGLIPRLLQPFFGL